MRDNNLELTTESIHSKSQRSMKITTNKKSEKPNVPSDKQNKPEFVPPPQKKD